MFCMFCMYNLLKCAIFAYNYTNPCLLHCGSVITLHCFPPLIISTFKDCIRLMFDAFRPKRSYGMGLSVCMSRLYCSTWKTVCLKERKESGRNASWQL